MNPADDRCFRADEIRILSPRREPEMIAVLDYFAFRNKAKEALAAAWHAFDAVPKEVREALQPPPGDRPVL